jgi:hypothetical protein
MMKPEYITIEELRLKFQNENPGITFIENSWCAYGIENKEIIPIMNGTIMEEHIWPQYIHTYIDNIVNWYKANKGAYGSPERGQMSIDRGRRLWIAENMYCYTLGTWIKEQENAYNKREMEKNKRKDAASIMKAKIISHFLEETDNILKENEVESIIGFNTELTHINTIKTKYNEYAFTFEYNILTYKKAINRFAKIHDITSYDSEEVLTSYSIKSLSLL